MATSDSKPLVCAIILNYNGLDHLKYSIPSILATDYQPLRVVVVDNASKDASRAYVRSTYRDLKLITSDTNRGWSAGNNLGIQYAMEIGARYVVLANNDIRVDPRWISEAVAIAESDPQIGIVGFNILEPKTQDADAGFSDAIRTWSPASPVDTSVVDGMAMFVRVSVFEAIGMIDEGFFVYAEDNDLCLRALRANIRVVNTNVPVWHRGSGTFVKMPLRGAALQVRNNFRLAIKHESIWGVLYQVARHFAKGCLPFLHVEPHDTIARRLRSSNGLVNFGIIVYAIVWNVWNLPQTLRQRRQDERRIASARARLGFE